jgi:acyl dehydratase
LNFSDPRIAFTQGTVIALNPVTITKEEIIEFATEFDAAPFHIDEEAAKSSLLGGLSASGFHTCALCMKMICDTFLLQSTSQGAPEVEEVKWLAPVRPDDTLSGQTTILESRQSNSKPDLWIAKYQHELRNQSDTKVMSMVVTVLFKIPEAAS